MATLRQLIHFLATHHLKRRYRIGLIVGVTVILIVAIASIGVHALKRPAAASSSSAVIKIAKLPDPTASLQSYSNSLEKTGKVQVSFYSLAPKPGSKAAKQRSGALDRKGGVKVAAGGDTKVYSASTYKLYIAAYVFHRYAQGKLPWDLTDRQNFDAMIINSENGYAQTILMRYGNDTVDDYLKTIGIDPAFAGDAAETTANNLVKILRLLDAGQGPFANDKMRTRLLKDMGKQVYRQGIPAGVASVDKHAKVQDKVGFLTNTNNDAGIVTTKDGHRYILVIMTTGHAQLDFSQIKEIAAHIQRLVYEAA